MRHRLGALVLVLWVFASCGAVAQPDSTTGPGAPPAAEPGWHANLPDAVETAAAEGKLVLMLAGRETCGNCTYMRETVCESDAVKPVLLEHYVTAFIDVDNSSEWWPYAPSGGFTLPLIAIIDPEDTSNALGSTTGVRYEDEFLADIEAPLDQETP